MPTACPKAPRLLVKIYYLRVDGSSAISSTRVSQSDATVTVARHSRGGHGKRLLFIGDVIQSAGGNLLVYLIYAYGSTTVGACRLRGRTGTHVRFVVAGMRLVQFSALFVQPHP